MFGCDDIGEAIIIIFFLLRSWELKWDSLCSTEESSASSVLLGPCVDLFKKGLIFSGLELVSGLAFCQGSSRYESYNLWQFLFIKFSFSNKNP